MQLLFTGVERSAGPSLRWLDQDHRWCTGSRPGGSSAGPGLASIEAYKLL